MAKKSETPAAAAAVAVETAKAAAASAAAISAAIDNLIQQDGAFDTNVHRVAMDALNHAATYRDIELIARLLGDVKTKGGKQFGKGVRSRRKALIEWLGAFSPIRVNGDGVIGLLKEGAKTYVPFNLEGAETLPFFDMPNERNRRASNTVFDVATVHGRIFSLTKAIDTAAEKGALNDEEDALRELAAHMQAEFTKKAKELGLDVQASKDRRQTAKAA